jgi:ketosteroid isomerase-like protein
MHRLAPALLIVAVAGCSPSQEEFTEADAQALRAMSGQFTTAHLAGNWTGFDSILAEDVVFLPPNATAVEGRQAVVGFLQAFPRLSAFTATVTDLGGSGNLAFARGTYTFTTAPDSGAPMTDQGKFLAIHRRFPDGIWRITKDIWNSDLPLPAPGN